jgi:hypothetical protein
MNFNKKKKMNFLFLLFTQSLFGVAQMGFTREIHLLFPMQYPQLINLKPQ